MLHDYSQSHFHLIHLADIDRAYLIYFQACNMLKILRNKDDSTQCILHVLHFIL